ncbi:MAG: hypothetical protein LBV56_09550 [Delftia acidovorans]|nr:hypothetical protein [Delftia acidovorans]
MAHARRKFFKIPKGRRHLDVAARALQSLRDSAEAGA